MLTQIMETMFGGRGFLRHNTCLQAEVEPQKVFIPPASQMPSPVLQDHLTATNMKPEWERDTPPRPEQNPARQLMPVIFALGKLRQEDGLKFGISRATTQQVLVTNK